MHNLVQDQTNCDLVKFAKDRSKYAMTTFFDEVNDEKWKDGDKQLCL